jgi:NTP pyrophosphatase (non-canonical NTP hydrolase)
MQWLSWLLWLQKRNREFNGWFRESPIEYYIDGARDEIEEIRKSLAEKNHDELELEVGDLLWDVLSLINRLDHEKLINIERVCPRAVAKFAERMPYNVEGYFEWNSQTREDIWNAVKKLQKARGVDEWHCLVQKVWEEVEGLNDGKVGCKLWTI